MVEATRDQPGLFRRLWRSVGKDRVRVGRYGLHAYGKLPIYKDFISTGLTDPAAREFRGWLDRGFSHRWSVDETYRDVEIPSHSFLLRLPEGKGYVAGSLWGSTDAGGLRRFPFTLFVAFPAGQPAAVPLAAVEYLALLDMRSRELREKFAVGGSLASLYQDYRGASFEFPLKTEEQVWTEIRSSGENPLVSEFAESLFAEGPQESWSALLEELVDASASRGLGGVRVPLGGAIPRLREIEFWLLWMSRQDAGRRERICGLLYPNGRGPGRATFLFRDLQPEDIFLFHSERVGGTDIRELPSTLPPSGARAPTQPSGEEFRTTPPTSGSETVGDAAPVSTAPAEIPSIPNDPLKAEAIVAEPNVEPAVTEEPSTAAASEASGLEAPFVEAEVIPENGPAPLVAIEPPLLDAQGHLRLTQPPFSLSAQISETAPEIASAPVTGAQAPSVTVPVAEVASPVTETAPSPAEAASPVTETAPSPAEAASPVTEAAQPPTEAALSVARAEPEPAAAPVVTPEAPPGWDRPLYHLLEA